MILIVVQSLLMMHFEIGVLLTSSYEVPGRYSRWTVGFTAPPVQIEGKGMSFTIEALNSRGDIIVEMIHKHLQKSPSTFSLSPPSITGDARLLVTGHVINDGQVLFSEEERSKQPSLFSLVRSIRELLLNPRNPGTGTSSEPAIPGQQQFGLVGAFGYDLAFQFEPVPPAPGKEQRAERDLLLFLPDEILVVDGQSPRGEAWKIRYDFSSDGRSTVGLPRVAAEAKYRPAKHDQPFRSRENEKGDYSKGVLSAKEQFKVGNLFEVVLSQIFREKLQPETKPSQIFNT